MPGKTLCRIHGGKTEKVSALQRVTHGMTSQYVHKRDLPEIIARAEELGTAEGRARAAAVRAAITEEFIDRIPDREEFIETRLKGMETLQKGVKLLKELDAKDATPAPTTIVLADYDSSAGVFTARGVEGPVSVTMIAGVPHIKRGKAWIEAVKQIDEETGLEFYTEVID